MAMFTKNVVIGDVHRVKRPGIGAVFVGKITIGDLAQALTDGDIKYAPKYQRGLKPSEDNVYHPDSLIDIHSDKLLIESKRAEAMAAKYLMALSGEGDRMLFNPDVIWNARREPNRPAADYDETNRRLTLHSTITVPDSAHRHFAYYLLKQWKTDSEAVPDEVVIAEDGETVDKDSLVRWLEKFNPDDADESAILVQVFNVPREMEGKLFDEYNVEGKKPSTSASIDMFSDKTASRRFVAELQKKCEIFGPSEVETRANTIAAASRKITTVSTLDVAIKPFNVKLRGLEKQKEAYADLIAFFCAFYTVWAEHSRHSCRRLPEKPVRICAKPPSRCRTSCSSRCSVSRSRSGRASTRPGRTGGSRPTGVTVWPDWPVMSRSTVSSAARSWLGTVRTPISRAIPVGTARFWSRSSTVMANRRGGA